MRVNLSKDSQKFHHRLGHLLHPQGLQYQQIHHLVALLNVHWQSLHLAMKIFQQRQPMYGILCVLSKQEKNLRKTPKMRHLLCEGLQLPMWAVNFASTLIFY